MSISWLLVGAILVESALEDVRSMSVSQDLLLGGWAMLAIWEVSQGHAFAVLLLLLLTAWGLGYGPKSAIWLFLPAFPYWPVLLLAAGAREKVAGEADVLAVSLLSLLSPWAGLCGFAGMMAWVWWRKREGKLWVPAMPGLLVGMAVWASWTLLRL